MTPSQQRLAEGIRDVAADIAKSLRHSDIPPIVWLGILGHSLGEVFDQIPQEARSQVASTFCDAVMTNVRNSLRFDA